MSTLAEVLARETRVGELYETLPDGRLRCYACGHCCPLPDGAIGVCKVRFNEGGTLLVPWGYVGGVQCDPIEKKPFFHAHPGALAYSFGMLGCDLHCGVLPELGHVAGAARSGRGRAAARGDARGARARRAAAEGARRSSAPTTSRSSRASGRSPCSRRRRRAGLTTGYVSNGNGTPQVLEYLRPWIDLYKVDLKSFDDRHYRELGGRIAPILDTIRRLHAMDVWVEIVTLLIPGFNDSRDELTRLTEFVASVSPDIPWHVTAFHGDYKMTDPQNTTAEMLLRGRRHRPRQRPALRLRGQSAGPRRRSRGHALRVVRRDARRALRLSHPRLPHHRRRPLPVVRGGRSGPLERAASTARSRRVLSFPAAAD